MRRLLIICIFIFILSNASQASSTVKELSPQESYKFGLLIEHFNWPNKRNDQEYRLAIKVPRITGDGCSIGVVRIEILVKDESLAWLSLSDETPFDKGNYNTNLLAKINDWSSYRVGAQYMCDGLGVYFDFGSLKSLIQYYDKNEKLEIKSAI